jgi:hypothetical protein
MRNVKQILKRAGIKFERDYTYIGRKGTQMAQLILKPSRGKHFRDQLKFEKVNNKNIRIAVDIDDVGNSFIIPKMRLIRFLKSR